MQAELEITIKSRSETTKCLSLRQNVSVIQHFVVESFAHPLVHNHTSSPTTRRL